MHFFAVCFCLVSCCHACHIFLHLHQSRIYLQHSRVNNNFFHYIMIQYLYVYRMKHDTAECRFLWTASVENHLTDFLKMFAYNFDGFLLLEYTI